MIRTRFCSVLYPETPSQPIAHSEFSAVFVYGKYRAARPATCMHRISTETKRTRLDQNFR